MTENISQSDPVVAASVPAADVPAPPPRRFGSRVSPGTIVLAAMFAGGIALMYVLGARIGPSTAKAAPAQAELNVESALSALTAMNTAADRTNAKQLVSRFYLDASQRQIPVSALKGNPFIFSPPRPTSMPAPPPAVAPPPPTDQDALREAKLAQEAIKTLQLQSVLTGAHPACMISSNLITEGQQIMGWTVVSIKPTCVVLRWKDQTRTLKMD